MIHTILVPLDGSPTHEMALPLAIELKQALGSNLVLVCVAGSEASLDRSFTSEDQQAIAEQYAGVKEEEHILSTDPRMIEHTQMQIRVVSEAEQYLTKKVEQLAEQGIQAESAVPYGSALEGILTEIELHHVDLVVMAAHWRSGISRMVSGSVIEAVLEKSQVPVLVIPLAK